MKKRSYSKISKKIESLSRLIGMGSKRRPIYYEFDGNTEKGLQERLNKIEEYLRGPFFKKNKRSAKIVEDAIINLGGEKRQYKHCKESPQGLTERIYDLEIIASLSGNDRKILEENLEEERIANIKLVERLMEYEDIIDRTPEDHEDDYD